MILRKSFLSMNLSIQPMNNKKIIFFVNSSWAAYKFRLNLANELTKNGFNVKFVIPSEDEYFIKISRNYQCIHLPMSQTGMNLYSEMLVLFRLIFIVRKERPDFLLSFSIKPNIYSNIVSSLFDIKTVNNISGLGSTHLSNGFKYSFINYMYRFSFKYAHKVFFQNKSDKNYFIKSFNLNSKKVRLIPGSGVDLSIFKPHKARQKLQNQGVFSFLYIGRVLIDKGLREFYQAAQLVKNHYDKEIQFIIVGDRCSDHISTIPFEEFNAWIESKTIKYLDYVENIKPLIINSDCVVLPSYREGLPRSLLESFALMKPIIASKVPGCEDVVDHEMNGFLCKPKSSSSLANSMIKMIEIGESKRNEFGLNGRKKVEKFFSEELVFKEYLKALR